MGAYSPPQSALPSEALPVVIPIGDRNPVSSTPWVTRLLLLTNVGVFLVMQPMPWVEGVCAQAQFFLEWAAVPRELVRGFPLSATEVAELGSGCPLMPVPDKPVRLTMLTSLFLHADLLHLGGNLLYLWIFGNNIEDHFGHLRYLLFYVVCGVGATTAFVAVNAASPITLVGASGAIAAVLGAYLILHPTARVTVIILPLFFLAIPVPALLVLGFWFVLQLQDFGAAGVGGGVAYLAHVAGFAGGAAVTLLTGGRPQPRPDRPRRRRGRRSRGRPDDGWGAPRGG
jgi:membrane associated rhomboid family serine protease